MTSIDDTIAAYSTSVFNHKLLRTKYECARFLRYFGISKDWARVTLGEMQHLLRLYSDKQLFEAAQSLSKPTECPKDNPTDETLRSMLASPKSRETIFQILMEEVSPTEQKTVLRDIRQIIAKRKEPECILIKNCKLCELK